jgi:hypothetical protein
MKPVCLGQEPRTKSAEEEDEPLVPSHPHHTAMSVGRSNRHGCNSLEFPIDQDRFLLIQRQLGKRPPARDRIRIDQV